MGIAVQAAMVLTGGCLLAKFSPIQDNPGLSAAFAAILTYVITRLLDGSEFTPEGKVWPWFQHCALPRWVVGPKGYFPGKIVYENKEALKSVDQAIIGAFPHGVVSVHHTLMMTDAAGFCTEFPALSGPRRRDLAATATFFIPIWRDLLLWMGCVDAGRKTARSVLNKGWSLYILPGGEMEQMLTKEGEHHVFVNKRKGFIKLALEYGVDLVPVYAFGETDMFSTYNFMLEARLWICKNLRIALPLARGIGPTILPRRVPLTCVVGNPIKVEKDTTPSQESVDSLHQRFVESLRELFDKHKGELASNPQAELHIH